MRVPLFDIDWTLLAKDRKHNIHNDSFFHAFKEVYGIVDPKTQSWEGKVDRQILVETAVLNGIGEDTARKKIPEAIDEMKKYFFQRRDEGVFNALPGVRETLEELRNRGALLGLLTGNVEAIAWAKLEIAGIKDFFKFGAFGDMSERRVDLIHIARSRAEHIAGHSIDIREFVIVGDSPLDVACAKEGGIDSIAVASGTFSIEELTKTGPEHVIPSLGAKNELISFLERHP